MRHSGNEVRNRWQPGGETCVLKTLTVTRRKIPVHFYDSLGKGPKQDFSFKFNVVSSLAQNLLCVCMCVCVHNYVQWSIEGRFFCHYSPGLMTKRILKDSTGQDPGDRRQTAHIRQVVNLLQGSAGGDSFVQPAPSRKITFVWFAISSDGESISWHWITIPGGRGSLNKVSQ